GLAFRGLLELLGVEGEAVEQLLVGLDLGGERRIGFRAARDQSHFQFAPTRGAPLGQGLVKPILESRGRKREAEQQQPAQFHDEASEEKTWARASPEIAAV